MKFITINRFVAKPLKHAILTLAAGVLLSSCGLAPSDGPTAGAMADAAGEQVIGGVDGQSDGMIPFVYVETNDENAAILALGDSREDNFAGEFTDRRNAADIRIGLGDIIRVTIFEAGSGGLFVPSSGSLSAGNFVSIPDQEVDRTGSITVPYAAKGNDGGIINVNNRRPIEVQADIEKRLSDRAIEPQVIVTIINRTSNLYSVIGDVNTPGRFNVPQSGIRLLDAIGEAGGLSGTDYETLITLQRDDRSVTARLVTLIDQPKNNVFVRPNDIISLKKDELHFNITGAVTQSGRMALNEENVTLADAIARAGGLDIERSNAHSVLLYREEDKGTLQSMGAQIQSQALIGKDKVQTVYRVDLKEPKGMFIAQKIPLRHNDMIYVANHPITGVSKVVSIVRDVLFIRLIDN